MVKPANNLLIGRLNEREREWLSTAGHVVTLRPGELLAEAGRFLSHAWFPLDSTIAQTVSQAGQPRLEIGLVGREGMLGVPLILGAPAAAFRAVVQAAGMAWRIDAVRLAQRLETNERLRSSLMKYAHVHHVQVAHTSGCRSFHRVEARLARWLLMSRDRTRNNELLLTHAALAQTLGVRRAGVTLAASALQERDLIRYARGHIELLDLRGLEAVACACYAGDKRIYARLLG